MVLGITLCLTQGFHHLGITMVEEAANLRIQCDDGFHVFGAKFKIEDVEILDDSFLPNRFRNHHDPSLCQPAQNYLSNAFLIFPGDRKQ